MLLFAHRIQCLAKIFGDVEPVMHDVGLRYASFCRTHKRRPHVHGYRLDRVALKLAESTQQTFGSSQFSFRYQITYPRALNVSQYADVAVSALGALFVQAKRENAFFFSTQHASFHRSHHDVIDGAPSKSREFAYTFSSGADLQQFDHKSLHQQGDSAVAFSPGHGQFLNSTIAVFKLGHACFNEGLKLACVQMSPLTFVPTVNMSSLGFIRGVNPHLASFQYNLNHHALVRQRKVHRFHRPR